MIYIYDILLNFCDCDLIYDFYEWNQNDTIENIKRIKLVHVDKQALDNLILYDGVIDSEYLLKIYRTCEVYTTKKVKILDYCGLFSDGERVIAIEFDKSGQPIYKSKLLLDEEEEIALLASNLEVLSVPYKTKKKILEKRFFTRSEIIIRKYLLKEIEEACEKKNENKLKYLYEEFFEKEGKSNEEMYKQLQASIKESIENKHKELYQLLKQATRKKQV